MIGKGFEQLTESVLLRKTVGVENRSCMVYTEEHPDTMARILNNFLSDSQSCQLLLVLHD
jgi:hypothetical protein